MTEHCPDCGRPLGNPQLCATNLCDSVWGDGQCQTLTIAKLRLELAAAKAASELSTAERDVVAAAVAKQKHADTFSAFANPTRRETQKANDLADALDDAVEALRAQKAEG